MKNLLLLTLAFLGHHCEAERSDDGIIKIRNENAINLTSRYGLMRQKRCIVVQKQSGTHGDSTEGEGSDYEEEEYVRKPAKPSDRVRRREPKPAADSENTSPEVLSKYTNANKKLQKRRHRKRTQNGGYAPRRRHGEQNGRHPQQTGALNMTAG